MGINWTTSQGQPSDSVGADGDMNYDWAQRFQWGPKGRITPGSWVGTANNSNPLYGAAYGMAPAQAQASIITAATTSTPQITINPNGGAQWSLTPTANTAIIGMLVTSNVAGSFDVYNQTTASIVVPSTAFAANATNYASGQPFLPQAYPLLASNTYVIRVTGSASSPLTGFIPIILAPAMQLGQTVSSCGLLGFSNSTTFATSGQVASFYGSNVNHYFRPLRAGSIYNIVGTFTPTGTSTAANYVNVFMNQVANGGNVATYNGFGKVFATGKPVFLGTFAPGQYAFVNSTQYWFNINADTSCTGTLALDLQLIL